MKLFLRFSILLKSFSALFKCTEYINNLGEKMGRLSIVFPDELEDRLRQHFYEEYGLRIPRGVISKFVVEAVAEKLDKLKEKDEP